jgi:hypothetical protein
MSRDRNHRQRRPGDGRIERDFEENNDSSLGDLASRITEMGQITHAIKDHLTNEQKIIDDTGKAYGVNSGMICIIFIV